MLETRTGAKLGGGLRLALAVIFASLGGLNLAQNPPAKILAGLHPAPAPAAIKTLLEEHGDFGNQKTKLFTVPGPDWELAWSFDCAGLGDSGNFSVKVMRAGASVIASVEKIGDRDSGTEHYRQSGAFYLQVVSECQWQVRVAG
jgi:hypothetical protein